MWCWPETTTNTMAADSMVSKLSDKIAGFVCGLSLPATYDGSGGYFKLLPSSSPEDHRSSSRRVPGRACGSRSSTSRVVVSVRDEDNDADDDEEEDSVRAMSSPRVRFPTVEEESSTPPCLAFPSQSGYKVFSLADMRACESRLRPVLGRRLLPSPYGGTVLAADASCRHPCRLVDPLTGEVVAPLPDLPLPRSETEPVPCDRDEPSARRARVVTDDGLAWDWSPRGVVVARGDTAFFHPFSGGEWTPVYQSGREAAMTVNHRGGRFFLFEPRRLRTTVLDAATLRAVAAVPPPPGDADEIDAAYLAPSGDGEAFLLVHHTGRGRGAFFTDVYRARLGRGGRAPRWRRVEDVGDRAVFLDGAHGFTVRAGPRTLRNHLYVTLTCPLQMDDGRPAAEYDVAVVDLRRPERKERLELDAGVVDRAWGWQPYWIIPKDGRRRQGDQ
jgi:hypothetical protein